MGGEAQSLLTDSIIPSFIISLIFFLQHSYTYVVGDKVVVGQVLFL